MKRNQWSPALVAFLIFCLGAGVGVLGQRYYNQTVVSAKNPSEDFRQHYVSEMRSRLRLNATQVDQLETILDETKAKYKKVRDQYRPAMLQVKNEQINRVKSILTPEQIQAYDQLVTEREKRGRQQEERDRKQDEARTASRHSKVAP
jgi:hypothetical protein